MIKFMHYLLEREIFAQLLSIVTALLCLTTLPKLTETIETALYKLYPKLEKNSLKNISQLVSIFSYIIVFSIGYKALISAKNDGFFPSFFVDECETEVFYNTSLRANQDGLKEFLDKCKEHNNFFTISAREQLEKLEYAKIKSCIEKRGCQSESCVDPKAFLSRYLIDMLSNEVSARKSASNCAIPAPVPAPLPQPEPSPNDPAWQQLSEAIAAAKRIPSAQADEAVREAYLRAKRRSSNVLSNEQIHIEEEAERAIRTLDESDARLANLIEEANRWKERRKPGYHDFSDTVSQITDYDRQRLYESKYQDAWNTLEEAKSVIMFSREKSRPALTSSTPFIINLDGSQGGTIGTIVVNDIRKNLASQFALADDYSNAALIITVSDASRRQGIWVDAGPWQYKASFQIQASWVGGARALFGRCNIAESKTSGDEETAINAAIVAATDSATKLFFGGTCSH